LYFGTAEFRLFELVVRPGAGRNKHRSMRERYAGWKDSGWGWTVGTCAVPDRPGNKEKVGPERATGWPDP